MRQEKTVKRKPLILDSGNPFADWTQTGRDCPQSLRSLPVSAIDFPLRIIKLAARFGLETIGDLLNQNCERLLSQKNIGRKSIRDFLSILQSLNEMNVNSISATSPAFHKKENGRFSRWNQLRAEYIAELSAVPCIKVDLPTRMRNFLNRRNIRTIEGLLSLSESDLLESENLGRKTIRETIAAIQELINNPTVVSPESLKQQYDMALQSLDERCKLVLRSRLAGNTLEAIGQRLHLTRERVRQIEAKAWKRVDQKHDISAEIVARLNQMMLGVAVPISTLTEDPWFRDAVQDPRFFANLLKRSQSRFRLIKYCGVPVLSRVSRDILRKIENQCWQKVERHCLLPVSYEVVRERMENLLPAGNEALARMLCEWHEDDLITTQTKHDQRLIIGWSRKRNEQVLALLLAAGKPLRKEEIEAAIGSRIGSLPDSVLYFGRGLIGLEEHFPDFILWKSKLIPRCIALMKTGNPERQWSSVELLQSLRSTDPKQIPEWMTPSHLGSLLKRDSEIIALGRFRFILDSGKSQKATRLHLNDLLVEELLKAQIPLPRNELIRRARARSTILETGVNNILGTRPFVQVDRKRWGLIERDLPGGESALLEAGQKIKNALIRTRKGMTISAALSLLTTHAGHFSSWSKEMVISVIRMDDTFRLDRQGGVGLAGWFDSRIEGYKEFLQRIVKELPKPTSITAIFERFRDEYGRAPSIQRIEVLAREIEYCISGPYLLPTNRSSQSSNKKNTDNIDSILEVLLG